MLPPKTFVGATGATLVARAPRTRIQPVVGMEWKAPVQPTPASVVGTVRPAPAADVAVALDQTHTHDCCGGRESGGDNAAAPPAAFVGAARMTLASRSGRPQVGPSSARGEGWRRMRLRPRPQLSTGRPGPRRTTPRRALVAFVRATGMMFVVSTCTSRFGLLPAIVAVARLGAVWTAGGGGDMGMSAKDWVIRFHCGATRMTRVVAADSSGGQRDDQ